MVSPLIHTSLTGQAILSSPLSKQNDLCVCYVLSTSEGTIGTLWLSPKEAAEIKGAGEQAVCHLVAYADIPPEERFWALCFIRVPNTEPVTPALQLTYSAMTMPRITSEGQTTSHN